MAPVVVLSLYCKGALSTPISAEWLETKGVQATSF